MEGSSNTTAAGWAYAGSMIRRLGVWARVWVRGLYDWVLHWVGTPYAVVALCVLSFAEASFFPIPPDVLLIAMCLGTPRRGFFFAALCAIASVIGGAAGYGLGALAWEHLGSFFYDYVPGFTAARFASVQQLYSAWGIVIVLTAGFSPVPYKLFTICSGVFGLPFLPFVAASLVGRSARFFLLAMLIRTYGVRVKGLIERYFNWFALGFGALLVGGFVVLKCL